MRAAKKKILVIAGAAVALIVVAAIAAILEFNINAYKSEIEAACSDATGLDVRINGRMGLSFFPFGISARDIHVAGKKGEVLSLERLKVGAEFIPLLRKQLKVAGCKVIKPAVTVVEYAEGKYNFETGEKRSAKGWLGTAFSVHRLKVVGGSLVYLDKRTGIKTELKEINLSVTDLTMADTPGEIIKSLSFTGNMDCKELRREDLKIDSIASSIKAGKGVFHFEPVTVNIFGARGKGDFIADASEPDAVYRINLNVPGLDFERFEESFGIKKIIGGKGDLVTALTVKDKVRRSLLSETFGTLSLGGNNLVTYTEDLDKVLSAYKSTQKFSLLDIGAFFLAGPLGTVALKGYRYGNLFYQARGGRGTITTFVSRWKIEGGEADAVDCALATRHNRVALKGKLNLVAERYDSVTVALLDHNGCAMFKQGISGSLGDPEVGAVSAVESLAGPFVNLYRRAKKFVQSGKCDVFYTGSVQPPR
jgi:uncharacterized protein involved in outer membrane biogenesis